MGKLKEFSYYVDWGSNKGSQYYIMASSQKQVVELCSNIKGLNITSSYVKDYFYQAWGTDGDEIMKDIEITEPCVYLVKKEQRFGKVIEGPKKVA